MILTLSNVVYVLVAVAMIVLILLQRGAGAAAGSGFGGGASATVFGARGASNFLSKSTAVLAALFFIIAMGMAMVATRGTGPAVLDDDLGVMSGAAVTAPVDAETPVAPMVAPEPAAEVPSPTEAASTSGTDVPSVADDAEVQSDKQD